MLSSELEYLCKRIVNGLLHYERDSIIAKALVE